MSELKPESVLVAYEICKNVVVRTPVLISIETNLRTGAEVFYKCENLQRVGAFKFRGAHHALSNLSSVERTKGVLAFSSGNHAQAIALAAKLMGIRATIVMPKDAPRLKIEATRDYGAEIVLYDRHNEDREQIAAEISRARGGLSLIPPFNHPDIIAGQGTAALELFNEVGQLDYLFIPVGGGGLIAGSALAAQLKSPQCKIIGVEPEAGNDVAQSIARGEIIKIPVPMTIADGAQTQAVGTLTFPLIQKYVKLILTVSDEELKTEMRYLMQYLKLVIEPTGCLGAAAISTKKIEVRGKRVGVILSGGNVDPAFYAESISL